MKKRDIKRGCVCRMWKRRLSIFTETGEKYRKIPQRMIDGRGDSKKGVKKGKVNAEYKKASRA